MKKWEIFILKLGTILSEWMIERHRVRVIKEPKRFFNTSSLVRKGVKDDILEWQFICPMPLCRASFYGHLASRFRAHYARHFREDHGTLSQIELNSIMVVFINRMLEIAQEQGVPENINNPKEKGEYNGKL